MNVQHTCYVIMGAAVWPDGQPSGAMRRRVEGALRLGKRTTDPYYLVTGGQGKFGPPEAAVMEALLKEAEIPQDRILVESQSPDTFASIIECTLILKKRDCLRPVILCTDRYHIPRCRWLFYLSGIATTAAEMPSGCRANGTLRWTYYYLREIFAIPWDTAILIGYLCAAPIRNAISTIWP